MLKLVGPFKQIITLADGAIKGPLSDVSLGIIEQGGILIEHDKIVKVDAFSALESKTDQHEIISEDQVLLPGFIDCHTHLVWGGSRAQDYTLRMSGASYETILAEGGGIFDSVTKTRGASKEDLRSSLIQRANRHLSDGITTIEVKSGYGLDLENELKILETVKDAQTDLRPDLIPTCLAAHVCPKEFEDKKSYLAFIANELFPALKQKGLTNRIDIFIEPTAFPVEIAEDYLTAARNNGFQLTIHADQFHTGGKQLAVEMGALSADHLEASTEKEITLIAESDTVAVALPGASLGLGMNFTPSRKLLDAGASLAIATDWNPGSAPMGDLLTQAAILGMYEKLTSAEIFAGITYRAAKALGIKDRGKLISGTKADFVSFPVNDYREVLYHQGSIKPIQVWKNGQRIKHV